MTTKRILCLANSRKLSGRCIAGKEILENGDPGTWIRPVSTREHQEVSECERQYEDGSEPAVLDIIQVPLIEARPHTFQQENWLLDSGYYWKKSEEADWGSLQNFVDSEESLWINHQSSYNGLNDRVPLSEAEQLTNSLRLIHVSSLQLLVFVPGAVFNNPKLRVQGQFRYDGFYYHLWVTDPVYEQIFLQRGNGRYNIGECCLTISLGEPHEDYAYKLIAAIFKREKIELK